MHLSPLAKSVLASSAALALLFLYAPLAVVVTNSFSPSVTMTWPPSGFTFEWWIRAFASEGAQQALVTSFLVALCATAIALVLGGLLSMALYKYEFFGKQALNLFVVLPIALPGIVTGIALNNLFRTFLDVPLGFATVVVAHATFCVVIVFNNVIARLKRQGLKLEEASQDLGANSWRTFLWVTLPRLKSALFAGGLLAFALSFDEIIVTTFTAGNGVTTVPIFILNNMYRPNQAPIVAVIAVVVTLISVLPVLYANKLSRKED
jgi:putative spermidine/putrescine transport system permease protein